MGTVCLGKGLGNIGRIRWMGWNGVEMMGVDLSSGDCVVLEEIVGGRGGGSFLCLRGWHSENVGENRCMLVDISVPKIPFYRFVVLSMNALISHTIS